MALPYAFVTLITSDSYLPGALAQAAALKDVHPSPPVYPEVHFQTVCLVTPEYVDVSTIKFLRGAFDVVIGVEIIASDDDNKLKLLGRPDLDTVLTKLHVFRLTQYSKIIFLDADVLPIRPLSHLFTLPHEFSAVPDVGWPDIFNSGVMVLAPGQDKFDALSTLLKSKGSWDGGDQGILNEWRADNWNRLSFTYNTTPTAAYTYAPAYERYGSDISAVHFIGPNKPWDTLSYRPPGSASEGDASDQYRAYDYDSLVDRWYAVYDRHYRSQTFPPKAEFEVRKFTSAWDEGPGVGASLPPSTMPVGTALGLDDLKRIAVEGMGASGASVIVNSRPEGEGEYQSMPLDGRVDLMRPKKEEEVPQQVKVEEQPSTPPVKEIMVAEESSTRWETLPTPAPNEIPSAPHIRLLSLPPSMPPTPTPDPSHHQKQTVEHDTHHEEPHQHPEPQHDHRPEPLHLPSPPLLSWNPAVEPPPKTTPPVSTFPTNTYFPNAWDHAPSDIHHEGHPSHSPSASAGFFHPPPPPDIPDTLLRQGHYRKVTGEELGVTPSPDRTKVKRVFPWEEQPRHLPERVFPPSDSDSPPPGRFLTSISPRHPTLGTPEKQTLQLHSTPSPLSGLPSALNYANAWDAVPSIQKYANWLSRTPPMPPALLAPAFDVRHRKSKVDTFRSWNEQLEGNSRDGDDEDSAEDEERSEDNEGTLQNSQWTDGSRSGKGRRSVSSRSPARKKKYVSVGVQTILREMKDQAVQVATSLPRTLAPLRSSASIRRSWPPASSAAPLQPVLAQDVAPRFDSKATTSSASATVTKPVTRPAFSDTRFSQLVHPTSPDRSSGVLTYATQTMTPPQAMVQTLSPPSGVFTTETGSPLSSVGPLSPPEGHSVVLPTRKAGRVWDPTREVEVFKRDSEEVRARFAKMRSWEDDTHSGS